MTLSGSDRPATPNSDHGPNLLAGFAVALILVGLPVYLGPERHYRPAVNTEFSWVWRHVAIPAAVVLVGAVAVRPGFWFPTRPTLSSLNGPGLLGPLIVVAIIWFAVLGTSAGAARWVNANVGRSIPERVTGPIVRKRAASGGRRFGRTYFVDVPIRNGEIASLAVPRATWDSLAVGATFEVALERGSLGIVYSPR